MNKVLQKRTNTIPNVVTVSTSEEQLDAAIFYCLNALTKKYSPSEQFRTIFVKGMFVKPNTKAFIHVLHFVLNVYDAKEFRKRFYWPIFDKNAESAFRSSTVEYVNSLVDRGKLDMERIKAHTVVLPGGIKFMKFLLQLISFVIKEDLRRTGAGTDGKIITKTDKELIIKQYLEFEHIGAKIREIMQKDLHLISNKLRDVDEVLDKICMNFQGPATKMSFEKLMQLWERLNRMHFEKNEAHLQRVRDITEEYNKTIVTAKRKLEPKEIGLGINEEELKETLYRLEVLYPDNACHLRQVFDEQGKINAIKLFQIITLSLPEIEQHFNNFSIRSIESLKFELKELSKVAVKSDSLCHELASLRRNLSFIDSRFQELIRPDEEEALHNDLGIRNKILNTPPISIKFQENAEGTGRPTLKRCRIALLDDEHIHQMNLRMRLLSSSINPPIPKTPRSARKPRPAQPSPGDAVFAVPKIARKERLNPLSLLNKITTQGKSKPKPAQPVINSSMNISSLSTLGEISLRPEFSSTLLDTPEKPPVHNRRSINANDTLTAASVGAEEELVRITKSPVYNSSNKYKTIYSEEIILHTTTMKAAMSPDSLLLLSQTNKTTRRRSSLLQLDHLQTSPSGKLEPLVIGSRISTERKINLRELCDIPQIKIFNPAESDSGICEDNRICDDPLEVSSINGDNPDLEKTISNEDPNSSDVSNTLVGLDFDKLSISVHAVANDKNEVLHHSSPQIPMDTHEEDLFNVSDGVLTDFD